MVVYKIENMVNKKAYIGITTKTVQKRINEHLRRNNSLIGHALNKYGIQSFNINEIDHGFSIEDLFQKEQYWIAHLNTKVPNGYNCTNGGDGVIGPSMETIDKKRKSATGKYHSEATKQKLRKLTGSRPRPTTFTFKGYKHTEDTKVAISNANTGRQFTQEHKIKLSNAIKGTTMHSEQQKAQERVEEEKKKAEEEKTGSKTSDESA